MTESLINRDRIVDYIMRDAPWSDSHGGGGDFLGFGLVYYALTYAHRAQLAVCLGSGGGFVPRLMRQAQRDLGIADESRTILVDGDHSEAGWGSPTWLTPSSFFRTEYPDIDLRLELTSEAARGYFSEAGLTIDYLHIDADHSFEGSLADFDDYRPFLATGSIVTLHDTNFPGSGVGHLVNHLRGVRDIEIIDFPQLGAGSALVRVLAEPRPRPSHLGAGGSISICVAEPVVGPAPGAKEWNYLHTEAFRTRNRLAASFVADCPTLVELGGHKSPIDMFACGDHERVIVVDPRISPSESNHLQGRPCRVSRVRARFQDIEWQIERPGEHGLLILGLELGGMSEANWASLYELIDTARVTVLEFAADWHVSCEQFERIRAATRTRQRCQVTLDLDDNELGELGDSWPPRPRRRLHVLEPAT